ncbi:MAG: hypothetical protein EBT80_06730 [Chitinophagales bacterium]|nr:hypothetical protein [Chitinophagales bacterium]
MALLKTNTGIGTTNPTSALHVIGDVLVTGVVTATTFNGNINTGVATITTATITDLTNTRLTSGIGTINNLTSNFNNTGVGTINILNTGIGTINNLNNTLLNVSGIASIATLHSPSASINVGVITDLTNTRFTSGVSTITDIINTRLTSGVGTITNLTGTNATLIRIDSTHINAGIITANQLSTGASGVGININNNSITGPSSIVIDPAGVGNNTGAVRIKGDLYIDGDQFYVNSGTIELADLRVGIATTVGSNMLLDGGGIGIGSTNILKTFTYNYASDSLKSSENLDIALSKTYKIDGTDVLSSNTLGSGVIYSSLQYLGNLNNLNVSGLSTLPTLVGTYATITEINNTRFLSGISSITNLYVSNGYINVGVITDLTNTRLTSGISTITNLDVTREVVGISTITNLYVSNGYINVGVITDLTNTRFTSGISSITDLYTSNGYINVGVVTDLTNTRLSSGIATITTLDSSTGSINNLTNNLLNTGIGSIATLYSSNAYINSGIVTDISGTRLNYTGVGTITTLDSSTGTINNLTNNLLNTGIGSIATFYSSNSYINVGVVTDLTNTRLTSGIATITTLDGTHTNLTDLNVSGISTQNIVRASTLNVSGVGTIATINSINIVSTNSDFTNLNADNGYIVTGIITDISNTRLTSGIATVTTLDATTASIVTLSGTNVTYTNSDFTNLNANNAFVDVGIVTDISGTRLTYTGVGTITTLDTDTAIINNLTSDYINVGVATATILNSGIGTINNLNNTLLNVSGVATITTLNTTNVTSTNSDFTNLNANNAFIDVGIVTDISGTRLNYTGVGTIVTLDTTNATIDYLTNTDLTVSGIATIQNLDVLGEFDVYDTTATFHNNVYIVGNLSIGGTSTAIVTQDLKVLDSDIILGVTTDAFGNDISNDTTANHGGIAVASTEGYPLVDLFIAGLETASSTYKKIMWFKAGSFAGLGTDAWLINYAVGIGSTQVPNNVRLAVGNVQITDKQINANTLEVSRLTSGIATITGADVGNLHSNNIYVQTGVITDVSGTRLNYTGVGTITTFNSTDATITDLDLQRLIVSGVSTFTNGPVLIGSGSQTGTLNQKLQVTGGAYISTYVGIGYTNPFSNLALYDNNGAWISLVDPGQSSSAIENNNGTLYIRAEQGAGNSRIIFQTGTSNYEQKPSVSGSDRVEIDSLGNLLVNMVTPTGVSNQRLQVTGGAYVSGNTGIGLSNATSRLHVSGDALVTGVVTATTFYGNFYGSGISTIGILDTQNLNVTGIITGGSYYIDSTQVISNSRELQNIVSLDTVTTATIEAAIANAPNDFQSLNVAGVSTFVNGPIFIGSGTTTGTTSQRLQVTGGAYVSDNFGVGVTNPTSKLQIQGDVLVSGVVTATTFNGQINSGVATITTLSGTNVIYTNSDFTNLNTNYGYIDVGIVTDLTNTRLTSGIATVTTLNSTQSNLTNINSTGINTVNIFQANTLQVSGIATFQDNVYLGINDVLNIGGTNYLKLFHDSGAAYIDNDTGILYYNSGQHFFQNAAGNEVLASFTGDGGASLYFDNSKKLEVIGTGVTITGTLYAQNLSTGASGIGINISNNTITGPSVIIVDPAAVGDDTGAVRIKGDLYVDGTEFIVNSGTIDLADLRVGIATTVGSNLLLDGGGIGIGSTNILKTFVYNYSSDSLKSSENLDIALNKTYKIDGVDVISSTTLGSGVVNSSLTSVGTLTQLNVAGIGTIPTLDSTNATITNINSTGISTLADIRAQRITVTGIVTANSFRPSSGYIQAADGTNSFYIYNSTGNVAFQGTIGVGQINNAGGYQVITFNNIDTRLTGNLDIAGVTTSSVFNGNVYSLGVSTFTNGPVLVGSGTSTGTLNQPLQVTGGGYISTNLGIGSTNPQYLLDVNGNINFNGLLYQNNQPFIASRWSAGLGNDIYRMSQVGIGTTNPAYDLDVLGDVRIRGGLYDDINNSAGLTNYVVVADGAGGWSWQPVTASGAGTLDGIEIRDQGNVVGTSGSITTLDFRCDNTNNLVVTGYAGGSIATISLSNDPIFSTLGVLNSSGLGIATANTLQVGGIVTFTNGPVLIGSGNSTGTTSQTLQVTGGGYVSGSLGIGTTNPQYKLDVAGDLNFNGNLYQNGSKFTSGIGIGSTSVNPISGVITPAARIGIGFTDINFVGTGLSVTGYGSTVVIDFGNLGGAVSISTVSPGISTAAGNLWWDSTVGDLKIYYNDGNSAQWVDANGGSSVVTISESAPAGALNGDLWWDSTYGILKVYYDDGSSSQWVDANSGAYINYWIGTSAGIHTTGNVGVGTTIPNEKLQVDGYFSIDNRVSYGTTIATTSSTSQVGIHSALPIATYRSVEYTIQATQGTNFHTTKIIALHDGSLAYPTEYGSVYNTAAVATYDVDVSGGNMRLLTTPASSSTTTYKIIFDAIKV